MEPYQNFSILFWHGHVDREGNITFSLQLNDMKEKVCFMAGFQAICNAHSCCYPVLCLN